MLDIKLIREQPDTVRAGIRRKGVDPAGVDEVLELDFRVRRLKTDTEALRAEQREKSKGFGQLKKEGKDLSTLQAELNTIKEKIVAGEEALAALEVKLEPLLAMIPNLPHAEIPDGKDEKDNVTVHERGELPAIKDARPHWEIGKRFGFEQERAGKISGSGFVLNIGPLARLERTLVNFFLDTHTRANGYTEVFCPVLVKRDALFGTGHLPKFEGEQYFAERDGLYLIPTAETPLTNIHADEILAESDLPKRYCAFTPCFRREAGAAGADTRGMIRVHQFSKVEMMEVVHPAKSYEALEALTENAECLLDALELPYRRMLMCTGDMGFANSKQYDLEVYAAGVGRWLEVSSCSNFESFQARRCKIRYRDAATGKNELCHTLNGSGLALPRIMIALLENGQQPDGSVRLPKAIHEYFGAKALVEGSL